MKALIVDDEIEVCQQLQREVKKNGCEAGYTTSPVNVLEELKNAENKGEAYDLLILDIKMPEMDGLSLLKKIQESASDLDFIIITGYGDEDKAIESIRFGVVDYLCKPISLAELRTAIFRVQQKRAVKQKMTLEHSILIVDDEKELCERIKRELKKEGYQVAVAHDGVEGLEYFKDNRVDAVILDIRMPGMSGLEMLRKCREIDDDFVPIVITAFSDYEKAVEALKSGVFNYFKKPVLLKELISSVRKGIDQIYVRKNLSARKRELQIKTLEKMVNELEKARSKVEEYSKHLEEKVKERTFEISVLYELSQQISYTLDYKQLSRLILVSLHKIVKYDICGSFLLKGDSGDIRIRLARPVDSKIVEQAKALLLDGFRQISDVIFDERKLTEELKINEKFAKDHPSLKGEIRSFFNVPLIIKGKTMGMLHISSLKPNAFNEGHIRLLYTIASQSSVAMERLQGLLKAEKSKIEKAVESMADGVIVIDENREVVIINPVARKVLHVDSYQGVSVEDISKLLEFDPVRFFRKGGQTSLKKEVAIYGTDYQAQISSVIGGEKEVLGAVVALRDISKEKEIDRMKSEFISIVGHELRTPLTSIKNAVNIIFSKKAGDINENQMRFLSMADRNINRLSGIINDLLDISRIESGAIKIESKSMDLRGPLDMAISSLSPGAREKSVSIRKEIPSDLPRAYGDSDKLEQIFINLLGNAIKFTPEGGRICVSANEVQGEDFIEISVTDTGMGICPDEIEKVFDRFYQVEAALTRGIQGTGLGLSIIKGLVDAHGGKIWAESKIDKGSKFVFTLPRYSSERVFKESLDREIAVAREKGTPLSLIMLKIEGFEYLNEACEEAEVFHMLDELKQIVQNTARRSTDRLQIQLGGGVIILPDTSKEGAISLGNRLKDALSKQTFKMKKSVRITVATGVATYPEDGVIREELMKKAQSESS